MLQRSAESEEQSRTGLFRKETKGTWSYNELNADEIGSLLAEPLCCIFRPNIEPNGCC